MDNSGDDRTTIMVVDDQESVRRIARRLLERLGYRVVEADSAAAALPVLTSEKIALLISDVVMPGEMDGVALARIAVERWPDIKIILTSGYPQGHIQSGGEALQSDIRVLSKPYRAQEFTEVVQASLGQ